jgi:hypothetical protein
MVDFLSPGTNTRRVRKGAIVTPGLSAGRAAFHLIAMKGPVNKPIFIEGPSDFEEVFGKPIRDSYGAEEVGFFFSNGGSSLYVNRIEHYTDPAVPSSLTAATAVTALTTANSAATSGSVTSNASTFPAYIPAGTVVDGTVDGAAVAGFTITAVAATRTLTGGTYAAGAASDALTFTVAGILGTQVVDLSAVAGNRQAYIDALNNQLVGLRATASGGSDIVITTDVKGSSAAAAITVIGGTAAAKTGATVAAFTAGSGNVGNDRAVTLAEWTSLMNTGFPGSATTSASSGTAAKWTSNTTGVSSVVQFTTPANLATLLPGFDLVAHAGTASGGAATALTVSASSPGAWGNRHKVATTRKDTIVTKTTNTAAATVTQLKLASVARIEIGDTIKVSTYRSVVTAKDSSTGIVQFSPSIVLGSALNGTEDVTVETLTLLDIDEDGVTTTYSNLRMSPLSKNFIEDVINKTSRTNIVVDVAGLTPSASTDPRPVDVTATYLGLTTVGTDTVSSITDADWIGSAVGKTGLYAYDDIDDFLLLVSPGQTSATYLKSQEGYTERRGDIFAIMDIPQGLEPQTSVTFVTQTANLALENGSIYAPWVKYPDPLTGNATLYPPSGMVAGVFARTFANRGIGKAPAGDTDGKLTGAVGVEYDIRKPSYDLMYPNRINAIQNKRGKGVVVFGSKTLDPTGEFGQISTSIIFIIVARQFQEQTQFALFEYNNRTTRQRVVREMSSYLRGLWSQGVLQGASTEEAFFIQCDELNNTASVRKSGKLLCRIGINTGDTIQFVENTLEQDTRAIDQELAEQQAG